MPYVPFVSEKPKPKPKPPSRPTGRKARKNMKKKQKRRKQFRITRDVTANDEQETNQDENFHSVPHPSFNPPPFRPPNGLNNRPYGPGGGPMRPFGGPFIPPRMCAIGPRLLGPPIGPHIGPPFVPQFVPPFTAPPGLLPNPLPTVPPAPEAAGFLSPPPDVPSEFERQPDTGMLSDLDPQHSRIPSPRDHPPHDVLDDAETQPGQTFKPHFNSRPEHKSESISRRRYNGNDVGSPERHTAEFHTQREEPRNRHHRRMDYDRESPRRQQEEFQEDRKPYRCETDRLPHREPAWSSPRRLHERSDERRRPSPRRHRDSDRDWRRPRKRSLSRGDLDREEDRQKFRRFDERNVAESFHGLPRHDMDHHTQHGSDSLHSRPWEDAGDVYRHEDSMQDDRGASRIWNDADVSDAGHNAGGGVGESAALHDIDERDVYRRDQRHDPGIRLTPDSFDRYPDRDNVRPDTFQEDELQYESFSRDSRETGNHRERSLYHPDVDHDITAPRTSRPPRPDRYDYRNRRDVPGARHWSPNNLMDNPPRRPPRSPMRHRTDYPRDHPTSSRGRDHYSNSPRDANRRRR